MALGFRLIRGSWYGYSRDFLVTAAVTLNASKDILTVNSKELHVFGVVFIDAVTLLLDQTSIDIGRSHRNKIWIEDGVVSRVHCIVYKKNSNWFVKDQRSKNGTIVNKVDRKDEVALNAGDKITVGSTDLEVFFK